MTREPMGVRKIRFLNFEGETMTGAGTGTPPENVVRRLALPQYFFGEAERSLARPGPYSGGSATSLLQDSVEVFLRIVAEHSRIPVSNSERFGVLMDKIGQRHPGVLGHKAPMDRLNKARVAFKHHGISVSQEDAANFCGNVRAFFNEISKEALNVDFWSISLVDIVDHRRTQNWLREAEAFSRAGKFQESLVCSAKAAAVYLSYRASLRGQEGELGSISIGGGPPQWPHKFSSFNDTESEFREWAGRSLEHIRASLTLMGRGVDIAAFNRFRTLMPHVSLSMAGTIQVVETGWTQRRTMSVTEQDALFCMNFVVDLAIRLQESAPLNPVLGQDEASSLTVSIERPCDVIVYPEQTSHEVIRQAAKGERLPAGPHPDDTSEFVAIIEDRQPAFVPRDCVRILGVESI